MEVLLLLGVIAIACLPIGPIIFYVDVFGNLILDGDTNLDSILTSKTPKNPLNTVEPDLIATV